MTENLTDRTEQNRSSLLIRYVKISTRNMASKRCLMSLFIYCYVIQCTEATLEPMFNIETAIIDTQHTFCNKSSHCRNMFEPQRYNISLLEQFWHLPFKLYQSSCCDTCSCDTYECLHLGTCCPDLFLTYIELLQSFVFQDTFCVPLQLKPRSSMYGYKQYPNTPETIKIIKKCPYSDANYNDNGPRRKRDELTQMCENEGINDISTKLPVTYIPRKLTFRNKYCAECHGYIDGLLQPWDLQIACNNATFSLSKLFTIDDLFSRIHKSAKCNIFFHNQELLLTLESCELYISACNISGKWKTYNNFIDTLCNTYTAPYQNKYKNIFCYMCNADETDKDDCIVENIRVGAKVTKSVILKYNVFEEINVYKTDGRNATNRCPSDMVFDRLQKMCLHIFCLEPKIYSNGSCINLISRIGGVGYKVFLHLRQTVDSIADDTGLAIEEYFRLWKDAVGLGGFINSTTVYFKRAYMKYNFSTEYGFYFDFYLPPDNPQNVSLIDSVFDMHETDVSININGTDEPQHFHVRLESFDLCSNSNTDICLNKRDSITDARFSTLYIKENDYPHNIHYDDFDKERFDFIIPIYNCPLVTLDSNYYEIHHSKLGVKLTGLSIILSRAEYVETEGSLDINVCQYTFDMIQRQGLVGGTKACVNSSYSLLFLLFIQFSLQHLWYQGFRSSYHVLFTLFMVIVKQIELRVLIYNCPLVKLDSNYCEIGYFKLGVKNSS